MRWPRGDEEGKSSASKDVMSLGQRIQEIVGLAVEIRKGRAGKIKSSNDDSGEKRKAVLHIE